MPDNIPLFKIHYKSIYLPILAFALLTPLMPIMGRVAFWASVSMVFCCLFYFLFRIKSINKWYLYWTIAFCLFFALSAFWALNHRLVGFVIVVRILPILIVTFSVSMYIKTLNDVYDILKVFYYVAFIVIIYLLLFVNISAIEERMSYDQLGDNWNTNSIGIQFVFAIYIGFILFWKKDFFKKTFYIIVSLLMLYVIFITGSRKAFIMLFIPLLYWVFFNKWVKLRTKFVILFLGIGLIYAMISIPIFYEVIGSRILDVINIVSGNPTGHEDSSRLFLILYGWIWFKEQIWIGYGINNYRVLSDATDMFAGYDFYAHCNYIELLVGVGIIGTVIFYSGYFYVILKAIKQKTIISQWVVVLFLTLLFLDIGQVTYYGLMYMFFICIGFSLVSLK